jgi:phage tail tape-measure protein
VGTVGGLACASAGALLGFVVGSSLFPVVGSIVGVLLGGVVGGLAGKRLSVKVLARIEDKIQKIKELNAKIKQKEGKEGSSS